MTEETVRENTDMDLDAMLDEADVLTGPDSVRNPVRLLSYGLKNPDHLHILDEGGVWFRGCEQEWFSTEWQRRAGCGPSVASNIMLYLHRGGMLQLPYDLLQKEGCLQLMEAMWKHVTPTRMGVNTVQLFSDGLHAFAEQHGYRLDCEALLYARDKERRPSFQEVLSFLADGLTLDCPVAFLNLSNGEVENLDAWHWVTIVRMDVEPDNGRAHVEIYDGNVTARVDLRRWCETTTEDGGFVHFRRIV